MVVVFASQKNRKTKKVCNFAIQNNIDIHRSEMENFEMVAKTFAGLELVLAEELRQLGAENVQPGRRMVSFEGDLEMLYKANMCSRTALRVLKPFYKFEAHDPDELYEMCKEYDWSNILSADKTFCIDTVANSDDFTHSHYVTYRVKDAIADWFVDRFGPQARPRVRLADADVMINVHISGSRVTLSLDSSGESLHKRGYRVAQTEAPINEVLAAGIILMSGWRGEQPFVDPMCGSGTFVIEAAMIAANIMPGIYRKSFAFEHWPDFDRELFEKIYNDDSKEREVEFPIVGADISPAAIDKAMRNAKSAGVSKYIDFKVMPIAKWEEAPQPGGVVITNPPYGERISAPDMEGLYAMIGNRLKNVFAGYHAWIIGYKEEYFHCIGLAPSQKIDLYNGALECELREYVLFAGDKKSYRAAGGTIHFLHDDEEPGQKGARDRDDSRERRFRRDDDRRPRRDDGERRPRRDDGERRPRRDDERRPRRDDGERRPRRDDERRPRRDDGERRFRRDDDRRGTGERNFRRYGDDRYDREEPASENPLAKRRNIAALKMVQNRRPTLPPPGLRKRGWRKSGEDNESDNKE